MPLATLVYAQSDGFYRRGILTDGLASFIPGFTMPTEFNVGLSDASLLTDLLPNTGGRYDVAATGQTIQNKRVKAHLRVTTSGTITLKNCLLTGEGTIPSVHSEGANPTGFVALGLLDNPGGATIILQDCVIEPFYHQYWLNCIRPGNGTITMYRTINRGGCTDSINFASGSTGTVTAYDCVIGPNAFCNVSYDQRSSSPPYWTHNDGVQIQSTGARFIGRNVTFVGRADSAKGDLSVLTGTAGYADASWGASLTYSGPAGLTAPVFDIDRAWFLRAGVHGQCSVANAGTFCKLRNCFVDWAETHLYGSNSMYHFRGADGVAYDFDSTVVWSGVAGPLSRTLNGVTEFVEHGTPLFMATQPMSNLDKSKAGFRLGAAQ